MARRGKIAAVLAVATVGAGILVAARADAAAGCQVRYSIASSWPGGFGANVEVTNLGDPVNGWTLGFTFPGSQTITQLWNGSVTQSGASVSVRDAGWNASIATNGTTSFGFNANGEIGTPSTFTLNGVACTGTTQPTTPPPSTTPPTTTPPTTTPPTTTPPTTTAPADGKQRERLDRGVISVRSGSANLVSWRWLATDPSGIGFNVYRGTTKLNASPITTSTNYLDSGAAANASYTVRAVLGGVEQAAEGPSLTFANGYLDVPIQNPNSSLYAANDASTGDLDGDGKLDLVLKWDPLNSKDNSQSGVTDPVYVDGYKLDGTRLWRINLGRNIRAGAHYTQFQVYDYDGDGDAEIAMKTADATVSGTGQVIGSSSADYRNSSGYVLSGPEYLTMFDGRTGAALSTVDYVPPRGTVSSWGDSYGNRVDRFLAGTAYLDGSRPSLIMARGYYTRTVVVAWDFRNGTLTRRWTFDSNSSTNSGTAGQGNHQLAVADVDRDGKDEIVYGSLAIDDNGAKLWNTGYGHGDTLHVGDLDPSRTGLEVFKVDEDSSKPSSWFADARTGQILWSTPANGDNGRGVSADIWSGSPGAESWSSAVDGVRGPSGSVVASRKPSSTNFVIWWDGDAQRELLDQTRIDKYGTSADTRLLTASGVHSNNGTKATPSLSADLLGDWREEVIWPTTDNTALRIYSTPITTDRRVVTLMHDIQYREAIAWQNTAYNQPPHPSFAIS
ncbi:cellulose binding domain-containing protein [Actinoplanes sp. LDG1-06]|uniref:Cellulose binding domain-containing protein n=1 Tax=Paractinoplanes ovalisporus TaxID=2810368 RepID=A0ABS2AJL5_9ACTN|nr:cellulose binding domain-containing protein [Actinoplanes ovalisporus]MBM2620024.1 cellulose binding domain-containing protein [Actinoplanes ovalisporus]